MTRAHKISIAVAAALSLSACAVGPNYHRPDVPSTPTFKEDQGWKPATPAQIDANRPWWSIYSDDTLDQLEQQVEVANQTLKADEATYRAAVEAVGVDRGSLFPSINVSASKTRSGGGASQQSFTTVGNTSVASGGKSGKRTTDIVSASGSWELDVWGRIRRTVESDVARAQASAADVAAARMSAQMTLAEDYFQLRAAEEQGRLYRTYLEDLQNALQITRNRVNAGVTTPADVYAAETQLESTQAAAVSAQLTRAKLEHAIAVLTGRPPAAVTIAEGSFTTVTPVVPAGVPSTLLERRPDVAAAERNMASSNALVGVAESAWFPSLTLTGQYSDSSNTFSNLIRSSNSLWSFGPSLAENVFNGGATLAQTREARANYDASVATYRQTVLSALQSVEDDLASLRVLEQQQQLQDTAVKDARASEDLTLNQYKAGVVDYSSVITVQTTRIAAEINLLSIRSQRLIASVDLISQIGGGWSADVLTQPGRGVPR